MKTRRVLSAVCVSVCLAIAIHTDWHFARPEHHRLSLGLWWHWMLAIPMFGITALYVARTWSDQVLRASIIILGSAVVVAGVLEPAWEYFVGGAPYEWAFGPERNRALLTFVGTGLVAYLITLFLDTRVKRSSTQASR